MAKRTCDRGRVHRRYYFVKRPSNPDKRQLAFAALATFSLESVINLHDTGGGEGDVFDGSWPRRKKTCVITIIVIIILGYLYNGISTTAVLDIFIFNTAILGPN